MQKLCCGYQFSFLNQHAAYTREGFNACNIKSQLYLAILNTFTRIIEHYEHQYLFIYILQKKVKGKKEEKS